MDEKDLVDLGLTAKGDRVKLQAFCNRKSEKPSEDREQNIAKIKEILGQGKGNRAKKRPVSDTAKPENDGGLKGKTAKPRSSSNLDGRTGYPVVDLSNRKRTVVVAPVRTTPCNLGRLSRNSDESFLSQRDEPSGSRERNEHCHGKF